VLAACIATDLNLLLKEIDEKREIMISTALATGFTSKETVTCSQELDVLINRYQEQISRDKKKGVPQIFFNFFELLSLKPLRITNKIRN
jgi:hypothetical protein